jgi:PKD repeat protein
MKIRNSVLALFLVFAALFGLQARAADAPVIINDSLTATATLGVPFSFAIAGSNSPTSYFASPLPAGLSISRLSGIISGTPTVTGTTNVVIGATNSTGTGIATLALTVAPSDIPVLNNDTLLAVGTVNTSFNFVLTSSGSGANYSASSLPAGLSLNPSTGAIIGTPTTVGTTVVPVTVTDPNGSSTSLLTIAIVAPGAPLPELIPAPVLASTTPASARVGTPFTYAVVASNSPAAYSATNLPPGLTINATTGVITGTPTAAGTYAVVLTATNATGTGATTLTMTVAPAPIVAPVITNPTASASATVGTAFSAYQIVATGGPTSFTASGLPPGLTLNSSTGTITGTPTTAGTYAATLTAANSAGSSTGRLTITVAPAPVAPTITSATTVSAVAGQSFPTYVITASGLPTSFGATGLPPGLSLNPTTGAISGTPTAAGTYTVTLSASNAIGTNTATLTVVVTGSRIVNFSARALSGPGDQTLVMGFVVTGNSKSLLVRGIGPGLTPYGVANVVADPALTLLSGSAAIATNDDWQATATGQATAADIAAAAIRVGAFALPGGSKDSALISTVNGGPYTTSMVRANATTGVALTEVYDLDPTTDARLVNVSARMNVSAGEGTLIAGLSIAGNSPKTVLVRGVGPTLTRFGVTGVLADPQISVFSGASVIASNDNWETGTTSSAQLTTTSAQVGAFALTAGSKDASLLVTLQPGSYTVQITGVGNTTGVALIEIYDTQ